MFQCKPLIARNERAVMFTKKQANFGEEFVADRLTHVEIRAFGSKRHTETFHGKAHNRERNAGIAIISLTITLRNITSKSDV